MHEFDSGFYTRTPAWHGLGTVLSDAPDIETAIRMSGTDWEVIARPVYVDVEDTFPVTSRSDVMDGSALAYATTHKALTRSDTYQLLGIVGSSYEPLQNKDAFSWFNFLLHDGDAELDAGGALRGGKRVWVLARLKGQAEVVPGDRVDSYVLLSNAHDGSMGVWISFTTIRVVCMNTLTSALTTARHEAKIGRAVTMKHRSGLQDRLEVAKQVINLATQSFDMSVQHYQKLSQIAMTDARFDEYVAEVFEKVDVTSLRAYPSLRGLYEEGAGSDIPGVKGTAWGAYNAITDWVDYGRGKDPSVRLNAAWFGDGKILKQRALETALKGVA